MELHESPHGASGHETPWNSMELPWSSREYHGASMELHVIPWSFHGTPWGFQRIPWSSMELYGVILHGLVSERLLFFKPL